MYEPNYDEPNYDIGGSYENYGSETNNGSNKPDIKKFMPIIIAIAIVIIALFIAFTYFGMQKKVTININELDGSSISNARLTIKSNGSIIYGPEMGPSHTTTLMFGSYEYIITAPGFNRKEGYLDVDSKSETIPIDIVRDIDAELRIESTISSIYQGQKLTGTIIIETASDIDNLLVNAKDSKDLLNITITPNKINLGAGGAISLSFEIQINENKILKTATDTEIEFTLQGTTVKNTLDVTANPALDASKLEGSGDVSEKNKLITDDSLEAGNEHQFQIKLKNADKTLNLNNLNIEVVADTGYTTKLNWFKFANEPDYTTTLSEIKAGITETIILYVTVPSTAQIGDDFKGKLIISSDSLTTPKEYTINLIVKKAVNVSLELSKTAFSVDCAPDCEIINFATEGVKLENKGTASAKNIVITIDETNSEVYCIDWIEIITDTIAEIKPQENVTLNLKITPTYELMPDYACFLKWTYDDPATGQRTSLNSDPPIKITVDYTE